MATGTELIFELDDDTLRGLLTAADLAELDDPDADFPDGRRYWLIQVADDAVRDQLRSVHEHLVRDRFDVDAYWVDRVTGRPDPRGTYLTAQTPVGRREFSRLTIAGFGAENDLNAVAGISIWSRYSPVWADWRFPHGGSGDPIRFDADLTELVEQARAAIAAVIPAAAAAPLTVVHQFY